MNMPDSLEFDQEKVTEILDRLPKLELFENPSMGTHSKIQVVNPNFINECPVTGEKDYATITIEYVPFQQCVEFRSLRAFMRGFYNESIGHELVLGTIAQLLVTLLVPQKLTVKGNWQPVDGTTTNIVVQYDQEKGFY